MAVSDFYTARWPDFICISAHYKYVWWWWWWWWWWDLVIITYPFLWARCLLWRSICDLEEALWYLSAPEEIFIRRSDWLGLVSSIKPCGTWGRQRKRWKPRTTCASWCHKLEALWYLKALEGTLLVSQTARHSNRTTVVLQSERLFSRKSCGTSRYQKEHAWYLKLVDIYT